MQKYRLGSLFFILLIAVSVTEIGTDIFIPCLPRMADFFCVDAAIIARSISAGFVGMLFGAPIYGPLSDSYGRKKIMMFGLTVFGLASITCSLATTAEFLIFARFFQGFGIVVGYVLGIAILKDTYKDDIFAKNMSLFHMALAGAPAVAPLLGGYIASIFDWQATFIALSILVVICLILFSMTSESLPVMKRQRFIPAQVFQNYIFLFQNRLFLAYILMSATIYAGLWVYLSEIPHVYHGLGVDMASFGYYQVVLVAAYVIGTYINERLIGVYTVDQLLKWALVICLVGALCMISAAILTNDSSIVICATMAIYCSAMGVVYANAATKAMDLYPNMGGAAAAVLTCIGCAVPACVVYIMSLFRDGTLFPVAIGLVIISAIALCLHYVVKQHIPVPGLDKTPVQ